MHAKTILHMAHNINKWLHSSWWKHGQRFFYVQVYYIETLKCNL